MLLHEGTFFLSSTHCLLVKVVTLSRILSWNPESMIAMSSCKLKLISLLCSNCHSYTGSCQGFQARIVSAILYMEYSASTDDFAESAEIWIKAIVIRLKSHNFPSDIYNTKQQFISANIFLAQRSQYSTVFVNHSADKQACLSSLKSKISQNFYM